MVSISYKIGFTPETLRAWVNKMEVDTGKKVGVTSDAAAKIKELERENKERYHRDEAVKPEIMRVWQGNRRCYGARKVWKQMKREGFTVARCTVARLMNVLGIEGVCRGKYCITTIPDDSADKPQDLVNREFTAQRPNQLWVADITYVATWLFLNKI